MVYRTDTENRKDMPGSHFVLYGIVLKSGPQGVCNLIGTHFFRMTICSIDSAISEVCMVEIHGLGSQTDLGSISRS